MGSQSPSPRDLVTIVYAPRPTMRRILDSGKNRWVSQIVILAFICASVGDPDFQHLQQVLPGLRLGPTLALVALALIVIALIWVLVVYGVSWLITAIGRLLEGSSPFADVRAAVAWGLVPLVWSVIYRIPIAFYRSKITVTSREGWRVSLDFLREGGCTMAVLILALQFAFDVWTLFILSSTIAEAFRFETWKGFAVIAITAAAPFVIALAAVIAFRG